jgi:hypothetical protein
MDLINRLIPTAIWILLDRLGELVLILLPGAVAVLAFWGAITYITERTCQWH